MTNLPRQAPQLSFVTLLCYDYRYAFKAIRSYAQIADEIILGVDAERLTMNRKPFEIDMDEVNREMAKLNLTGKVRVVEGNFHASDHPMENETRERSELSLHCAAGNWIVQIDADEILLNPQEFRSWLIDSDPQACAWAQWISVYKVFRDRALVIHPSEEWVAVATRLRGAYSEARTTGQKGAFSPLRLLHYSWGRTAAELRQKLENWSHSADYDFDPHFQLWESVTLENYPQFRNFHPTSPALWPGLAPAQIKFAK